MRAAHGAANQNEWVKECWCNAKHAAKELGATPEEILKLDPDEEALKYTISRLLEIEEGKRTSIPQFMIDEGLEWQHFSAWIEVVPARAQAWERLKKERNFFDKESLRDGWWRTAQLQTPTLAEHSDVARARDALARSLGVFTEKVEHTGTVTVERIKRTVVDPASANGA